MAGEGGIPVSKQAINHEGALEMEIACQRQSAFAVQVDLLGGSTGGLVIKGRTHPGAKWLPLFTDDQEYREPKECGLLRFYWSAAGEGPSEITPGNSFTVGFDCNYLHDVRIEMGDAGTTSSTYIYGY